MTAHLGSAFEDFLAEEGILEISQAVAVKRVIAYTLLEFMEQNALSKTALASQLNTSRAALDRLLDENNQSVTLESMLKVAQVTGKRLEVHLV